MKKYTLWRSTGMCALGALLLMQSGALSADDDTDHFLLPETPPTIERMKRPPLDRPFLKRQNFISDTDVVPPPVLLGNDFEAFTPVEYPVSVGLGRGSFSSSSGDFLYSSKAGWQLSYHMLDSRGEYANLRREDHRLSARLDRADSPDLRWGGAIDLDQNTVWTQRHDLYRFSTHADWFAWSNMNIKARLGGTKGEISGMDSDTSWWGDILVNLQPAERQNVRLSVAPRYDSSFINDRTFCTYGIGYDLQAARWLTVSAGGRYQKDTVFPQGALTFRLLPRLTLNTAYEPGFERPEWSSLYFNDRFETVNPGILTPESSYLFRERLSYYWNESSYCDLKFSQGKWKNYVYWAQVAGTDLVAPANAAEEYVSSMALDFKYTGTRLTPSAEVQLNSNTQLPFVPACTLRLGLQARVARWTMAAGYRYVSAMYFATTDTAQLDAFGDLSLSVARSIAPGIEVVLGGDNLLGEKIATQPGFIRRSAGFQAALKLKF